MKTLHRIRATFGAFLLASTAWSCASAQVKPAPRSQSCDTKADTLFIYKDGQPFMVGTFVPRGDGQGLKGGPISVYIWRNFAPEDANIVRLHGLQLGKAYLGMPDRSLKYLCDVDLQLSDRQMLSLFSVKVTSGK